MSQWIVSLHDSGSIRKMKDAGADEILLAVPFFSLRPAHVFALEELASLTDAIHACGLRAAVNCTRLFMEEDLPALRAFLRELKELQVDTLRMKECSLRPLVWIWRIVWSISRIR